AQLLQPACDDTRTHAFAVDQHEACVAHGDPLVCRLDELPARRVRGPGYRARGEFLRSAHVKQHRGAPGIVQPCFDLPGRSCSTAMPLRQGPGAGSKLGEPSRIYPVRVTPRGAALELETGENPTLRAILQRIHRVRDTEIDQRLRADDRAC